MERSEMAPAAPCLRRVQGLQGRAGQGQAGQGRCEGAEVASPGELSLGHLFI